MSVDRTPIGSTGHVSIISLYKVDVKFGFIVESSAFFVGRLSDLSILSLTGLNDKWR